MITTPIRNFCVDYANKKPLRLHMPGHKGKDFLGLEEWDLTEIDGADDLYHAEGIIAESEANASRLFGCRTFYSTEGSSLCIRAMLFLALHCRDNQGARSQSPRPWILAGRNAHKVFMYAAALLDFDIEWVRPEGAASYHACPITAEQVEAALKAASGAEHAGSLKGASGTGQESSLKTTPGAGQESSLKTTPGTGQESPLKTTPGTGHAGKGLPAAVYLTSPDYLGHMLDIKSIANVCHRYGVPLLVDNAHGAYLHFLNPSLHPMDLGADLCCDSAHKTLPALTGGAYLHMKEDPVRTARAKEALGIFGSTSPSYLILQSLDLCNPYLEALPLKLKEFLPKLDLFREKLRAQGYELTGDEPMKVTIKARPYGYTGTELAQILAEHNIYVEFYDPDFVVLMPTPETEDKELEMLGDVLCGIRKRTGCDSTEKSGDSTGKSGDSTGKSGDSTGKSGDSTGKSGDSMEKNSGTVTGSTCPAFHIPEVGMSPRRALFAPQETLPVKDCLGRIFASAALSCPPAIPIVYSGEVIDEEAMKALSYYGITECKVVSQQEHS